MDLRMTLPPEGGTTNCFHRSNVQQVVERFGQRRVREDSVFQNGVRQLAHHRDLDHRHNLTALYAQNGAPQNLLRVGVYDGFHKAPALAHLQRPRHIAHRHLGHANVQAPGPRLRFTQTYAPELRIYENSVRHETIINRRVPAFNQIGSDDAVIVVRDVSELRAALHVAEGVDSGRGGFQSIVHFDEAVPIGFDSG